MATTIVPQRTIEPSHHYSHHISVTIGDSRRLTGPSHPPPTAPQRSHTMPHMQLAFNAAKTGTAGRTLVSHAASKDALDDSGYDEMTRAPAASPELVVRDEGGARERILEEGDIDPDPPYRCPVSTPANFVHPPRGIRRSKAAPVYLEFAVTASPAAGLAHTQRTAGGRLRPAGASYRASVRIQDYAYGSAGGSGERDSPSRASLSGSGPLGNPGPISRGTAAGATATAAATFSHGSSMARSGTRLGPTAGVAGGRPVGMKVSSRTLDYYYVDKQDEEREAAESNTLWLGALCSQPVTEILDKYRRRSELRRTRSLWSRTSTTPGERSLLRAWERNAPQELGHVQPLPRRSHHFLFLHAASPVPSPSPIASSCPGMTGRRGARPGRLLRHAAPAQPGRYSSQPPPLVRSDLPSTSVHNQDTSSQVQVTLPAVPRYRLSKLTSSLASPRSKQSSSLAPPAAAQFEGHHGHQQDDVVASPALAEVVRELRAPSRAYSSMFFSGVVTTATSRLTGPEPSSAITPSGIQLPSLGRASQNQEGM